MIHFERVERAEDNINFIFFRASPLLTLSQWNAETVEQHIKYLIQESDVLFMIAVLLVGLIAAVGRSIIFAGVSTSTILTVLAVFCRIFRIILFGIYTYSVIERRCEMKYNLNLNIIYLGNATIATFIVFPSVAMLCALLSEGCLWNRNGCDDMRSSESVLLRVMVIYPLIVILSPIIIKVYNLSVLVLSVLCGYAVVFAATLTLHAPRGTNVSVLISCIFVLALVYIVTLGSVKAFLNHRNLEESVRSQIKAELAKETVERQTIELRNLIGNIAHDLKTPLQAFLSELDGLIECRDDTSRRDTVDSLRGVCSFMTMMINRSIDYTKVSSGFELVPSLESVDLVDSIKWVLNCVGKGRVRETCVSLVADALPADVHRWLITDRQWLLENLLCLTSNAVKFVTKGSIHVRVQLDNSLPFTLSKSIQDILEEHEHVQLSNSSLDNSSSLPSVGKPSDADVSNHESDIEMGFAPQDSGILRDVDLNDAPEFLRFEIEDTGIGISDELRLKLFKPFQQTQRMAGGTGLGLFALSERTKALGGHCGVSDRKDGQSGCCFWFTIPYRPDYTLSCKAMSRSQGSSYESSSLQCSSGNGSGIEHVDLRPSRILIVDDSILIQKTTSRSLTKEGFSVDIAVNGEECVRMTAEKEYDLVLLDLQMPVMNGLEAIARIRARETERITARMTRELASSHDRGIDSYDDGDRDGTLVVAMKLKAFHERLFVIGVSANSDSMSKQEALAAGMDSFIPKPLTIEALRECCWKFRVELYPIRAPSSFEAPLLQGEIN